MYMDKVTEAIAHFIGLFETTIEQARLRKAYDEFDALRTYYQNTPDLPTYVIKFAAPHEFMGYDPRVPYMPLPPELVWAVPWSEVTYTYRDIVLPDQQTIVFPGFLVPGISFGSSRIVSPEIEPIGSIAAYLIQTIRLSDDDYVGVAGKGVFFNPASASEAELASLFTAAARFSPFTGMEMDEPGSSEEIVAFIQTAGDALKAFPAESEGDADLFVEKSNVIEGSFVNGAVVDELPDIYDHLPKKDETEEDGVEEQADSFDYGGTDGVEGTASAEAGVDGSSGDSESAGEPPAVPAVDSASQAVEQANGTISVHASVELDAGGNKMLNTVSIANNWLSSPVFATMGDSIEINAIIQINVWTDSDLVGPSISDWAWGSNAPTQAFNIATFERIGPAGDAEGTATPAGGFPKHWVVTEITGDLLLINWIEQIGFMTDNDVSIMSASGVKLTVGTGGNTMINETLIAEWGKHYDLVIIGGNIYDANIIQQMNVLLDDDLIGAVEGFQTTGSGSISTGGNLLWNQAAITNIGSSHDFQALPEHYRKAGENLENGKEDIPDEVLNDAAFAGLAGLRVLYISGDYINLHYIKQTNVLGDSDQIALAMDSLQAHPEADWTVSTGSNALVNFAGIVDLDAKGMTYVGGGRYSDEILIQAELISTDPLGGPNGDALVNEAVAFLSDEMLDDTGLPSGQHGLLIPDASQADVMQTMLA